MKPVLVVTVCRRYSELAENLAKSRELFGEFSERPDVVVVWARPEVGRLWFFRELLASGAVDKVISRLPLPEEASDRPTTYPESHNIRLGLEYVRSTYDPATTYALVLAADVCPRPGMAFKLVDEHMTSEGARGAVFHWPNGCVQAHIWHTNFFATCLDEAYWPPVLGPDAGDTLEWAWGKQLLERRLPGILESHNSRERKFVHAHLSEHRPEWPVVPLVSAQSAPLLTSGCLPWWRRALQRLRLLRPFQRGAE